MHIFFHLSGLSIPFEIHLCYIFQDFRIFPFKLPPLEHPDPSGPLRTYRYTWGRAKIFNFGCKKVKIIDKIAIISPPGRRQTRPISRLSPWQREKWRPCQNDVLNTWTFEPRERKMWNFPGNLLEICPFWLEMRNRNLLVVCWKATSTPTLLCCVV